MKIRTCAVAGMFYPGEPSHLEQLLGKFFAAAGHETSASGIVAPHAGYIYSGAVAAQAYAALPSSFDGTFVVIGPSHRGFPTCTSAVPWETPLGIVDTDTDLVSALDLPVNEAYHADEHSLEVQMPFIKYRFPRARIAPVLMGDQDLASSVRLGRTIARAAREARREIRVIASSDFSHYVPDTVARSQDLYAIEALKSLEVELFYSRLRERGSTACGYGTIAAMITASVEAGAEKAELLKYATSGDVTGDRASVVGYAAIAVI